MNPTRYIRRASRVRVDLLATAETPEEVDALWEQIHAALDAIPGVFCQGGEVEPLAVAEGVSVKAAS